MGRKLIAFLAFALFCALVSASSSSDYDAKDKDVVKGKYESEKPSYYVGGKYGKDDDGKYDKKDDKYGKDDDDKKYEKKDEVYKYEKKEKKKYVRAKKCMFKFCHGKRLVVVGKKNDRALTSAICSKKYGVKIGSVDQTGEARLLNKKHLRISKWKPYGLKQHYSPSFFKAYAPSKYGKYGSGIGHEVAQQNQAKFLHHKCWILPLKAYQVWNKETHGWKEHYGKDPYVDCISFCTVVPKKYRY